MACASGMSALPGVAQEAVLMPTTAEITSPDRDFVTTKLHQKVNNIYSEFNLILLHLQEEGVFPCEEGQYPFNNKKAWYDICNLLKVADQAIMVPLALL